MLAGLHETSHSAAPRFALAKDFRLGTPVLTDNGNVRLAAAGTRR